RGGEGGVSGAVGLGPFGGDGGDGRAGQVVLRHDLGDDRLGVGRHRRGGRPCGQQRGSARGSGQGSHSHCGFLCVAVVSTVNAKEFRALNEACSRVSSWSGQPYLWPGAAAVVRSREGGRWRQPPVQDAGQLHCPGARRFLRWSSTPETEGPLPCRRSNVLWRSSL